MYNGSSTANMTTHEPEAWQSVNYEFTFISNFASKKKSTKRCKSK